MGNENEDKYWRRRPSSVFFPLLLIGLGVVILLHTLGWMQGNLWDIFLKGWPVLLIVGGLDSLYRQEGIASAVAWAGLGVILLLANLGWLPPVYWSVIGRIWPFALVVWGLDLLLSRKSWWTAGLAFIAGLAVVGLLYWVIYFSPFNRTVETVQLNIPPENAEQADINVEMITGKLSVNDGAASGNLADGAIQVLAGDHFAADYTVQNDSGRLKIKNDSGNNFTYWLPGGSFAQEWQVNLTGTLPLNLDVSMVMGDQRVDLSGLQVGDAKTEVVMGRSVVTLPTGAENQIEVSSVMGVLTVYVPQDVSVIIDLDTVITALSYPDDFTRSGDVLQSPGAAADALQVHVSNVMGSLRILYE
jgi:hypothetical protein